eukprot:27924_1
MLTTRFIAIKSFQYCDLFIVLSSHPCTRIQPLSIYPKTQKMSVFSVIKMDEEYKKKKLLFNVDKDREIDENACVHRLIFILKMYQKWVEFQKQNTSNIIIPNMR